MAAPEELRRFVRDGLARGVDRSRLRTTLKNAGWDEAAIRGALSCYADVEFPLPVPRPQPYLSARDAFVYLLLFTALYLSAFSLGQLLFELINYAFPDLSYTRPVQVMREQIRWSVSLLIVAGPLFVGLSKLVGKELAADPAKRASKVRRWLTYLTLFVAAAVLIGDITTLVFNLLGGELTTRFLLKVLTVGALAGGGFWYYLSDLRADERETEA